MNNNKTINVTNATSQVTINPSATIWETLPSFFNKNGNKFGVSE